MNTLALLVVTILADDPVPEDDDVVAGPWGALVFVLLIAATVFLLWNFTKQLRKAQAAKDAGVFGDEPVVRRPDGPGDAVDQRTDQRADERADEG